MDETTWMACNDPRRMLEFLLGRGSERKLRLFAVACCRQRWRWLEREKSRLTLETAEQYAEGLIPEAALSAACHAADRAQAEVCEERGCEDASLTASSPAVVKAACLAMFVAEQDAGEAAQWAVRLARKKERASQWALMRDLFGNPFRPVALDVTGLGPAVISLARAAYDQRDLPSGHLDPARLAVLADALEEAGCTVSELLGHLRQPGQVHVRGCWAVDLCLGKE